MGRLTKTHRQRLEEFLPKLDKRLEDLGRPFLPEISKMTLEFLQPFVDEIEAGQYAGGSFLKNSSAHIWRSISETIVLRFPDYYRPIVTADREADPRLNKKVTKAHFFWDPAYVLEFAVKYNWLDQRSITETGIKFDAWRRDADQRSADEAQDRVNFKFQWGSVEYERLYELALRCLKDRSATATDTERCVKLIYALSFFTGRRPWEEVGRISVFREVDHPEGDPNWIEHADDWLEVEGIGKKSVEDEISLTIPIFGVSSAELVEALVELRMIQAGKKWFDLTRDKGQTASSRIIGALGYQWRKFREKEVDPCFERPLSMGYTFEHNASKNDGEGLFNAYDLRRLYVSYSFFRYREFCSESGIQAPEDPIAYAQEILGHSKDGLGAAHTQTYTLFSYRDSKPLQVRGAVNTKFSTRQVITC
jgi:hypothetical protein